MRTADRPRQRRTGLLGSDRGGALGCRGADGRRPGGGRPGGGRRLPRGDSGASAIEFAMLTPVMFFMIFGTVQVAMYSFAQDVAKAAAQAGARTARAEADVDPSGWAGKARRTANHYIATLAGDGILGRPNVSASYADAAQTRVRVEVSGEAVSIVPALQMRVTASSEGPVERFIPDGG